MLMLLELQVERCLASGADHEKAHAVLRNPEVGAVYDVRSQRLTQAPHCVCPGRVENPVHELRHVLNDCEVRPIDLCIRHWRPRS